MRSIYVLLRKTARGGIANPDDLTELRAVFAGFPTSLRAKVATGRQSGKREDISMTTCINFPIVGTQCFGELTLRLGDHVIDLTHPGVPAIGILVLAIGVYVFRSPA